MKSDYSKFRKGSVKDIRRLSPVQKKIGNYYKGKDTTKINFENKLNEVKMFIKTLTFIVCTLFVVNMIWVPEQGRG